MKFRYYAMLCIGLLTVLDTGASQHQEPSRAEMLYGKDPLATDPNACINHIIASLNPKMPAIKSRLEEIRKEVADPRQLASAEQSIKEIVQEVRKATYLPRIMQHYTSFCIDGALEKEYHKLVDDKRVIPFDEAFGILKAINNTVDEVIQHRRFKIFTPEHKDTLKKELFVISGFDVPMRIGTSMLAKVLNMPVLQLPSISSSDSEGMRALLDWYDLDAAVRRLVQQSQCKKKYEETIIELDERLHGEQRSLQEILKDVLKKSSTTLSWQHTAQLAKMVGKCPCETFEEYNTFVEALGAIANELGKQADKKEAVHKPSSASSPGTSAPHMKSVVQHAQRLVLIASLVGFGYWLYLKCTDTDEREQPAHASDR